MAKCIICGKEYDGCLCEDCRQTTDIDELCNKVIAYKPCVQNNPESNPIWEQIASEMTYPYHFRNLAYSLAEYLPSPQKEWQKIHTIVTEGVRVPRASKEWFYQVYERIITSGTLDRYVKYRIKGLMLEALYQDYRYQEADALASELLDRENLPWQTVYVIAEFFSQTRRYDEADDAISIGNRDYGDNRAAQDSFRDISEKNNKRRAAADAGKKEYMPSPKEGKDEAVRKYTEYMTSIGIDVSITSTGKTPKPVAKGDYPDIVETRDSSFDNFVAFDFETTGMHPSTDSIIEVGAIKVVNGEIIETAEFIFQEFVKPYKKSVSSDITNLTGITRDDVKDARQMWEVIPDFMKFVGDNIMVGFNSVRFDARFLQRAGRYSNEVYTNKHFDVWRYAKEQKDKIRYTGEKLNLSGISDFLGIQNPNAHRALADAITTARVFLKIREMVGNEGTTSSAGDVLDLEEW